MQSHSSSDQIVLAAERPQQQQFEIDSYHATSFDDEAQFQSIAQPRELRRGGGGRSGGRSSSSRSSSSGYYYYGGSSYGNCYGDRCSAGNSGSSGYFAGTIFCCVFCCVFGVILCKNGACKGCSKCCKGKGDRSYNKDKIGGDEDKTQEWSNDYTSSEEDESDYSIELPSPRKDNHDSINTLVPSNQNQYEQNTTMGLNATKERRLNQVQNGIPMPVQQMAPAAPVMNSQYAGQMNRPLMQQKTFNSEHDPRGHGHGQQVVYNNRPPPMGMYPVAGVTANAYSIQ